MRIHAELKNAEDSEGNSLLEVLLVGYETVDIIGWEMYTTTKGGGPPARVAQSIIHDDTPNLVVWWSRQHSRQSRRIYGNS